MTETLPVAIPTEDQKKLEGKIPVSTEVTPGPGKINIGQLLRGLLITVISAVLPLIYAAASSALSGSPFVFPLKPIEYISIATASSYILAKLAEASKVITTFKKP